MREDRHIPLRRFLYYRALGLHAGTADMKAVAAIAQRRAALECFAITRLSGVSYMFWAIFAAIIAVMYQSLIAFGAPV